MHHNVRPHVDPAMIIWRLIPDKFQLNVIGQWIYYIKTVGLMGARNRRGHTYKNPLQYSGNEWI